MILNLSTIVPKELLTKSGNKTYPLYVAYTGEKILIKNTKDKYKDSWYPTYFTVPEGEICLWYSWPAGRNQNQDKNNGFRYNYLLLPRHLPLDKLTMNALGLLQAEMTKGSKRKSNISFTNSEPNLINIVMLFFKRFGLQEKDWSWSVTFNFKLRRYENNNETKEREAYSKLYWLRYTDIIPEKIRNKHVVYTGNKKYLNFRRTTAEYGSLRIDYSNIILFQVIMKLLEDIDKFLYPSLIVGYLQGIFAGEASVRPTKYDSLNDVNIGAVKSDDQQFYTNCLLKLGISSSFDKNGIRIHNLKNFLKIHEYNLLVLHPQRHNKFLHHLASYKQIPKKLKVAYSSFLEEVNSDEPHQMV